MIKLKYALVLVVALGLLLSCGIAQAQTEEIVIHHSWKGDPRTLNVHITGAPSDAAIDVIVEQLPDHGLEDPNGDPPDRTDEEGCWPGEEAGGEVGYPGTAEDPAGTQYVIKVRINGQTGPSKGVTKPRGIIKTVVGWITLGLFCNHQCL
jgi:hypothetical protein